jgi:alkane 1-monooxygenase
MSLVAVGLVLGGAWTFLVVVTLPIALCALDSALGFERDPRGARESLGYRILPGLCVVAQIGLTVWAAAAISNPSATLLETVGYTASVGLSAGVFGMLAAHELIHRKTRTERALGLTMLATVGYMHFRIAHIHGHHVRAATFEDPTTARRGESAYRFIPRAVVGQAREAWAFEVHRLGRRARPAFSGSNRMLRYAGIEILVGAGFAAFGAKAFAFWLAQSLLAIIMLELFNYIAHYGLSRREHEGKRERLGPRHSWNCSRRMNNWSLFNMGRHSDHHRRPSGAYQSLEPVGEAPELPMGYAGSILLALAPPLWRGIMHPRLERWVGDGDLSPPNPGSTELRNRSQRQGAAAHSSGAPNLQTPSPL